MRQAYAANRQFRPWEPQTHGDGRFFWRLEGGASFRGAPPDSPALLVHVEQPTDLRRCRVAVPDTPDRFHAANVTLHHEFAGVRVHYVHRPLLTDPLLLVLLHELRPRVLVQFYDRLLE